MGTWNVEFKEELNPCNRRIISNPLYLNLNWLGRKDVSFTNIPRSSLARTGAELFKTLRWCAISSRILLGGAGRRRPQSPLYTSLCGTWSVLKMRPIECTNSSRQWSPINPCTAFWGSQPLFCSATCKFRENIYVDVNVDECATKRRPRECISVNPRSCFF